MGRVLVLPGLWQMSINQRRILRELGAKAKAAREEDEPGEEESEAKLVIEVEVCSVYEFHDFHSKQRDSYKAVFVECLDIILRDGAGRFREERSKSV
ncbi:hypothetical protein Peur_042933 [Populus x canadensis]